MPTTKPTRSKKRKIAVPKQQIVPLKTLWWWAVVTPSGNLKALNSVKKYAIQHATWSHGRHKKIEDLLRRGYRVVRVSVTESF